MFNSAEIERYYLLDATVTVRKNLRSVVVLMRITRSEAEWSAGEFGGETLAKASRGLRDAGTLILEDIINPALIREAREAFLQRYDRYLGGQEHHDALRVGDKRLMITVDLEPPFERRELIANPLLLSVLKAAFEDDVVLAAYGVVCSLPEAPRQHIHHDGADLFRQAALNRLLPVVAVTVGIPLREMNAMNGTTALWPRSHRDDSLALTEIAEEPDVREGSCAIWDYRLRHGGTPNRSNAPRPLLYMTYCRAWFLDHKNYLQQAAVRAPKRVLADLPEDLRRLLARAQAC
jgi:ectoine hydroxylase-related dioxygenase (phytanoyl-CoA dioxygenase family)